MEKKALQTISKTAIDTLDDTLSAQPKGLGKILLAYSPKIFLNYLQKGRLRLFHLKKHEDTLEETYLSIKKIKKDLVTNLGDQDGLNALRRATLEQLEKELRLLGTVKQALSFLDDEGIEVSEQPREYNSETDALWWDLFEDLASRRNESWRVELFAKSLVLNDKEPSAISLKSLWEIAMMETGGFAALKVFLDSSVSIDGKAMTLMEPLEQYTYEPDVNEYQTGNLALCITGLIDKGLVQYASTQFITSDPVKLEHASGPTYLIHQLESSKDNAETAIRLDGYSATDCCLEINRLYRPEYNVASDRNCEILKELLISSENEIVEDAPKSTYVFTQESPNK